MSILYFSFLSFTKRFFTSLMIIIETATLLFGINYLISAVDERKVLFEPYEKFLNNDSIYIYNSNIFKDMPIGLTENESKEQALSGLIGNYREIEVFHIPVFTQSGEAIILYVYDDDIFLKMNFPLSAGNWITKKDISNGAIASNHFSKGNININIANVPFSFNIKGILTDNTYLPTMEYWGSDMSCIDFYKIKNKADEPFIFIGRSAVQNINNLIRSGGSLLIFDNLSPEEKKYNEEYLINANVNLLSGEKIREQSLYSIYEDLQKFIPLIFCIGIIVLIGIISFSCIIFKSNQRDNGIYFMYGNTRNGSLKILAGELSIILILSYLLTVTAFWVGDSLSVLSGVKFTLSAGNIIITFITIFVLLLSMMIIPYMLYRKNTPIEIMRRSL